ncbi:MAG TPA: amidohydrolase family protein [Armatimonadota bacterium]|nr:amidohydrolase family protein [Armatimonadota bacterium]
MNEARAWKGPILDGHVHMGDLGEREPLLGIMDATGADRMALVSIQDPRAGAGLGPSLVAKALHPDRFYVFAGPNHAQHLSGGAVVTPSLAAQAQRFARIGCDGMKLLEGKPTSRREVDVPITDPYFAEFWECVEGLGTPLIWHVGDPETFWDPARIPGWARDNQWGYGPEDVALEVLYTEVDAVLARHPRLRVAFAHFYFLSADLDRAGRFLDDHPTVSFDLAPGIEMLYNMSEEPVRAREFFIRYADRIVFGTDIWSGMALEEARHRAGMVHRWLITEDEFRVSPNADYLLGPPEDGIIRGMALPDDVLERVFCRNFERFAGVRPRPLDAAGAADVCDEIARAAQGLSGTPTSETQAGQAADRLRAVASD